MNVLLFTSVLLMLLTILTYARLETFRSSQGFQILFHHYMEEKERGYVNEQATKRYETTHIKGKKSGQKTPKVNASPRVPIFYLLNAKEREAHPTEAHQYNTLLKKLMISLYGNQPFFKDIEQQRPTFLDEILHRISDATDSLSKEKQIKVAGELSNLDLGDVELNEVFYKMLNGAPRIEIAVTKEEKVPQLIQEQQMKTEQEDDAEGQALDLLESQEYKSPTGYDSLLDYITAQNIPKIRIYLASPTVLKAIFNDPNVVQDILSTRKDLYQQIIDEAPKEKLSEIFKNSFQGRQDPSFDEKILDYSVSKTNPAKYEG